MVAAMAAFAIAERSQMFCNNWLLLSLFFTHMIFDFNSIAWIALLAIDDAIILRGRTQARTRVHTIMLHHVSRRITSFFGGAEHQHWYSNTYNCVTMPLPHCNAHPPPAPLHSIMRTPSSPPLHP